MTSLTLRSTACTPPTPSLLSRFTQARTVARQRKVLANLEDHILDDIGISRAQATREAARPAWDVPSHWMK